MERKRVRPPSDRHSKDVSLPTHIKKINVLLTVHRDMSVQYEPTGCTIYFQFISIIKLYMFRAGLLLIIRKYYSVHTRLCRLAVGRIDPAKCQSA